MTLAKRTIRYGGAMLDQNEIDAVVGVMRDGHARAVQFRRGIGEKLVPRDTRRLFERLFQFRRKFRRRDPRTDQRDSMLFA